MIDIAEIISRTSLSLSPEKPFASLGIVLDSDEARQLTSLHVGDTAAYNNFGALDRFEAELGRFFAERGNEEVRANNAATFVNRFVMESLSGLNAQTAWITVRASNPMTDFDIPRWHRDGYYYSPYEGEPRKIVLTLKGQGTLLNLLPEPEQVAFDQLHDLNWDKPDLQRIVADATSRSHTIQARLHEAYLYISGAPRAAIHSEPPLREDRLFMSIVPGTLSQIADLRTSWDAKPTTYSDG